MKFLVLSCFLASAIAAPSGIANIAPLTPVILPVAPTVDPGDIEAAAINAKVFVEDQARLLEDQARLLEDQARLLEDQARHINDQAKESTEQSRAFSEQTVEDTKDKTIELSDQVKEKSEDAFWSVEDKKWQALDAVKTAEARLDGAIASNPEINARSAFGVVVPFSQAPIAPGPIAPIVTPFQPILTPLVYNSLIKEEIKKDEKKEEAITKTSEGEKKDEKLEGDKKPAEFEKKPLALTPFFVAPFVPGFQLGQPILPGLIPFQYGLPTPLVNQW